MSKSKTKSVVSHIHYDVKVPAPKDANWGIDEGCPRDQQIRAINRSRGRFEPKTTDFFLDSERTDRIIKALLCTAQRSAVVKGAGYMKRSYDVLNSTAAIGKTVSNDPENKVLYSVYLKNKIEEVRNNILNIISSDDEDSYPNYEKKIEAINQEISREATRIQEVTDQKAIAKLIFGQKVAIKIEKDSAPVGEMLKIPNIIVSAATAFKDIFTTIVNKYNSDKFISTDAYRLYCMELDLALLQTQVKKVEDALINFQKPDLEFQGRMQKIVTDVKLSFDDEVSDNLKTVNRVESNQISRLTSPTNGLVFAEMHPSLKKFESKFLTESQLDELLKRKLSSNDVQILNSTIQEFFYNEELGKTILANIEYVKEDESGTRVLYSNKVKKILKDEKLRDLNAVLDRGDPRAKSDVFDKLLQGQNIDSFPESEYSPGVRAAVSKYLQIEALEQRLEVTLAGNALSSAQGDLMIQVETMLTQLLDPDAPRAKASGVLDTGMGKTFLAEEIIKNYEKIVAKAKTLKAIQNKIPPSSKPSNIRDALTADELKIWNAWIKENPNERERNAKLVEQVKLADANFEIVNINLANKEQINQWIERRADLRGKLIIVDESFFMKSSNLSILVDAGAKVIRFGASENYIGLVENYHRSIEKNEVLAKIRKNEEEIEELRGQIREKQAEVEGSTIASPLNAKPKKVSSVTTEDQKTSPENERIKQLEVANTALSKSKEHEYSISKKSSAENNFQSIKQRRREAKVKIWDELPSRRHRNTSLTVVNNAIKVESLERDYGWAKQIIDRYQVNATRRSQNIFPGLKIDVPENTSERAALERKMREVLTRCDSDLVILNFIKNGEHRCLAVRIHGGLLEEISAADINTGDYKKEKAVMIYAGDPEFVVGGDYGSLSVLNQDTDEQNIYISREEDVNIDLFKQIFGRDRNLKNKSLKRNIFVDRGLGITGQKDLADKAYNNAQAKDLEEIIAKYESKIRGRLAKEMGVEKYEEGMRSMEEVFSNTKNFTDLVTGRVGIKLKGRKGNKTPTFDDENTYRGELIIKDGTVTYNDALEQYTQNKITRDFRSLVFYRALQINKFDISLYIDIIDNFDKYDIPQGPRVILQRFRIGEGLNPNEYIHELGYLVHAKKTTQAKKIEALELEHRKEEEAKLKEIADKRKGKEREAALKAIEKDLIAIQEAQRRESELKASTEANKRLKLQQQRQLAKQAEDIEKRKESILQAQKQLEEKIKKEDEENQQKLQNLKSSITKLNKRNKELESEILEGGNSLKDLQQQSSKAQSEIDALNKEASKLKQFLSQKKAAGQDIATLDEELRQLNITLLATEETKTTLTVDIEEARRTLENSKFLLSKSITNIALQKDERDKLLRAIEEKQEADNKLKALDGEVAELETAKDKHLKAINDINRIIGDDSAERNLLVQEIGELKINYGQVEKDLVANQSALQLLEISKKEKEDEITQLVLEVERLTTLLSNQDDIKPLKEELEELRSREKVAKQAISDAELEKQRVAEKISENEEKISLLKNSFIEITDQRSSVEYTLQSLAIQRDELKSEIAGLDSNLEKVKTTLAKSLEDSLRVSKEMLDLTKQQISVSEDIEEKKRLVESIKEEMVRISGTLKDKFKEEGEQQKITDFFDSMDRRIAELKNELVELLQKRQSEAKTADKERETQDLGVRSMNEVRDNHFIPEKTGQENLDAFNQVKEVRDYIGRQNLKEFGKVKPLYLSASDLTEANILKIQPKDLSLFAEPQKRGKRDDRYYNAEFNGIKFLETEEGRKLAGGQGFFNDAILFLAKFEKCEFTGVDFSKMDRETLGTIKFTGCTFHSDCKFPKGFRFKDSNIPYTIFRGKVEDAEAARKLGLSPAKEVVVDEVTTLGGVGEIEFGGQKPKSFASAAMEQLRSNKTHPLDSEKSNGGGRI